MSLNKYKRDPNYPDRYTRNTGWNKILPVQGRPIQTAELIEVQSILQDNIKQGFNTLFKNGTVISGLRISVSDIGTENISLLISAGQIYIEGHILDVAESVLNIPATGLYNIDVIVEEEIIDETTNPNLRDPIKGAFTVGTPGAARQVWRTYTNFSREDDFVINGYAIAKVSNGVILQRDINPFYQIEKSVAQFIYEKSGNFCVEGFEATYLGFDKKVGSDISKQEELQTAVQIAKDEQQRALANATSQQTRISNLENQLNQATLNAIVDRATYQPIVARLTSELANAKLIQAQYSEDLIDASKTFESANTDLKNIESLITDQQIISISPGVAYVEGYRVAINSPIKLFIPQSFPTKTVENASFTYRAETSQTIRTFNINDGTGNIIVPQDNYITIELKFEDINNSQSLTPELITNKFSVEVIYRIEISTTLNSVLASLEQVLRGTATIPTNVRFIIRDEEQLESPEITTKTTVAGSSFLTETEKRIILAKYINTTKNSDTLIFKAQSGTLKPKEISVDVKSNLYKSSNNEKIQFNTGIIITPNPTTLSEELSKGSYKLGFTPVNKITRLSSDLQTEAILIRSESGIDKIQNEDTVLSIDSIEYQKEPNGPIVTFTSPLDYTLTRNNIEWELSRTGTIPAAGTSYKIKYTYTEVLVQDIDYILNRDTDSIEFIGRTPKINGRFNVDYSYFLSKAGVVTVNKDGEFEFSLSAASKNPIVPSIAEDKLAITSFIINSSNLELQQLECRRQTVKELYSLARDIRTNKENNEALKLDLQRLQNILISEEQEPIGIFSTTFNNLDKIDRVKSDAAFIPGIQAATNGFFSTELNTPTTFGNEGYKLKNPTNEVEYITIPYTEVPLLKQPRATKTIEVVPISKNIPQRANIYLSERVLFKNQGIKKTEYITINDTVNPNNPPEIVSRDYYVLPSYTSCDPLTKKGILFSTNNEDSDFVQDVQSNIRTTIGPLANTISSNIEKGTPTTLNNLNSNPLLFEAFNNVYTREIELDVFIDGLPMLEKNINILIDGETIPIDSTKVTSGSVSTLNFGINASLEGTAVLKIKLPSDLLTGTHTLELFKEKRVYGKINFYVFNNLVNQLVLTPVKNWNAQPISVTSCTQVPIEKLDIFSEEIKITGIDPAISNPEINSSIVNLDNKNIQFPPRYHSVNQTFVSTQNYFLTSAEVKVYSQPQTNNDILLNMYLSSATNKIPDKNKLSKAYITPNNIKETTVDLGSAGEYTKFTFRDLPQIQRNKRYNLGLESQSPSSINQGYKLYSAVVDDLDLTTNTVVGNQLYLDGDLLTTKDGISLYQEEKEDLTFNLYRAEFEPNFVYDLGPFAIVTSGSTSSNPDQNSTVINYFCLNTRDIIPEGTDIIYRYSIDASRNTKVPFKPNTTICLNSPVATIYIEAELITNFTNVAPQMLLKGSTVSLYTLKDTSELISTQVSYPEPYKNINITLQNIKPAGTDIKVYYSPTNGYDFEGEEWLELVEDTSKTFIVNTELQLYETTYTRQEEDIYFAPNLERTLFRYKIVLTSNNGLSPIVKNITNVVS